MFNLFGGGDRDDRGHDERVERVADELDRNPLFDVTGADHTDNFEDPPLRNGRRADVEAQGPFRKVGIEVDSSNQMGSHDRDQMDDLREYDRQNSDYTVERLGPSDSLFDDPLDDLL